MLFFLLAYGPTAISCQSVGITTFAAAVGTAAIARRGSESFDFYQWFKWCSRFYDYFSGRIRKDQFEPGEDHSQEAAGTTSEAEGTQSESPNKFKAVLLYGAIFQLYFLAIASDNS